MPLHQKITEKCSQCLQPMVLSFLRISSWFTKLLELVTLIVRNAHSHFGFIMNMPNYLQNGKSGDLSADWHDAMKTIVLYPDVKIEDPLEYREAVKRYQSSFKVAHQYPSHQWNILFILRVWEFSQYCFGLILHCYEPVQMLNI